MQIWAELQQMSVCVEMKWRSSFCMFNNLVSGIKAVSFHITVFIHPHAHWGVCPRVPVQPSHAHSLYWMTFYSSECFLSLRRRPAFSNRANTKKPRFCTKRFWPALTRRSLDRWMVRLSVTQRCVFSHWFNTAVENTWQEHGYIYMHINVLMLIWVWQYFD